MIQLNRAASYPAPQHRQKFLTGARTRRCRREREDSRAPRRSLLPALLAIAAVTLAPLPSYGQACPSTTTQAKWVGSATSGAWSLPLNWGLTCYPDSANTSVSIVNPASTTVELDTSVAVDDLTIEAADALAIAGGAGNISLTVSGASIANAGALNLHGNGTKGTAATLYIGHDATLSGGGTVNLSSESSYGRANISQSGSTFHTLTNTDDTIRGNGVIGSGGLELSNGASGTIDATSASGQLGTLSLTGGGTITNSGLLEATSGTLVIDNPVANSGGNITANAGTVELGDAGAGESAAYVTGGTLSSINGGLLETAPGQVATLDGVTISKGTTYTVPDNSLTHLLGTITNNGTVAMTGGNGQNSTLLVDADVTLAGGGTVTLSTNPTHGGIAQIAQNGSAGAPVVTLTNADNTIVGNGDIGNGGLKLVNEAGGMIDATTTTGQLSALSFTGGTVTNQGLMEATGGATLLFQSPVTNDANATLAAGAGSALELEGNRAVANQGSIRETGGTLLIQDPITNTGGHIAADGGLAQVSNTITGGTLSTADGGTMETVYSATLNGVSLASGSTYTASNDAATHLQGSITNHGTIAVAGGNGTNGTLYVDDDVVLSGGGTIALSTGTSTAYGNAALVQSGGTVHTLTNTDNTIEGNGLIGAYGLKVVNQGVIDATTASGQLGTLTLTGAGTVTNQGLLEATSGTLVIYDPVVNTGGNITASGGTVKLGDAGAGETAAYVTGGTLNTTDGGLLETAPGQVAALDGVTISGGTTYTAPDNSLTHVLGTMTNHGTIALTGGNAHNSVVNLDSDVTLTGGGTVAMATDTTGGGGALIQENGAAGTPVMTLTNVDNRIQGNGAIGDGGVKLVNESAGTIRATTTAGQSSTLYLRGGGAVTNAGTLAATAGAELLVSNPISSSTYDGGTLLTGSYDANGTIQLNALGASGGEIVTNAATIDLDGSGAGAAAILDAAGKNALSALADNDGNFSVQNGGNADFTTAGDLQNSGSVHVDTGTTLTMGAGGTHDYDQSGGATTVDGTLTGSAITVTGGMLDGTGTVAGAVTVDPGAAIEGGDAPGTLTVSGSLAIDGTLIEQIGGSTAGQGYGVLDVTGDLGLSGTQLSLDDLGGFTPSDGETFDIANAASITGTFAIDSLALDDGTFAVNYLDSGCAAGFADCVELTWMPSSSGNVPEPGSLMLFAPGLLALAWSTRRKRAPRPVQPSR